MPSRKHPARTGSRRLGIKPTGECWCGCGQPTNLGKFWLSGHDSTAKEAVIDRHFGDTIDLLATLGYGPGKRNAVTGEEP